MASGRLLLIGVLAVGIAGGLAWLLWPRAPALPAAAIDAAATAPLPPASDATATVTTEDLMQRAREQLATGALVAPAAANAVETYLAVLRREPEHAAARAAIVEMQPMVTDGVRGALAGGDWAEAERLLGLLRQLDADSVLLTPLASELDRRRAQALAPEAPSVPATLPPDAVPAPPVAAAPVSLAAVPAAPAIVPTAAPAAAAAPPPASATPPPASAVELAPDPAPAPVVARVPEPAAAVRDTPARLLNNPPLGYPPQARRQRIEGWVEVEVRIDAAGEVSDVRVVRAEPAGVFDREALRTAQRWRFAPREVDGQPTATTARRRVNFSLGGP